MPDTPPPEQPERTGRPEPVHDPRVLRAIAHPVRTRILDELSATGPMRAADIARELGVPANQASFHLRQLAKYGVVVEAPEEARDGRDRVWKAVNEAGFNVNTRELAEVPGGRAAVTVFRRAWSEGAHDAVRRAEEVSGDPDVLVMISDTALRLSREDADAFSRELTDLAESWRRRGRSSGGEGTTTYQLLQILQPARDA